MKKLLFALSLLSVVACHKKDSVDPQPVVHALDPLLIDSWNFTYNNHSNVAKFTHDSLTFLYSSPVFPSVNKTNTAYTSHDTIFINSTPRYTYYVADKRLSLTDFTGTSNYILTKVDTVQQHNSVITP